MDDVVIPGFRAVPRTGVIYVTREAVARGFTPGDPNWCNLGQGQPETGDLPGAPPRVHAASIDVDDRKYAPVVGLFELRAAVADLYNRLYRLGMPSQYTAENVCISGGGRAALTRAAASLGHINLGHLLPGAGSVGERIVPVAVEPMPLEADGRQLRIGDGDPTGVLAAVEF
jgi:hypothetical protein